MNTCTSCKAILTARCDPIAYDIATAYAKEGAIHINMNNVEKKPINRLERIDI